jgi:glycosyltransferase involved in cell wall biosynthesis
VVRFVPPVPHAECQARIQAADLLLLLAQEQPSQVPQKMYEYLATGRPVIAFADEEGETAAMLREVGGHHLVTGSAPAGVAEALATALRDDGCRSRADAGVLREWSADRQMQRLVHLLEEVGS